MFNWSFLAAAAWNITGLLSRLLLSFRNHWALPLLQISCTLPATSTAVTGEHCLSAALALSVKPHCKSLAASISPHFPELQEKWAVSNWSDPQCSLFAILLNYNLASGHWHRTAPFGKITIWQVMDGHWEIAKTAWKNYSPAKRAVKHHCFHNKMPPRHKYK